MNLQCSDLTGGAYMIRTLMVSTSYPEDLSDWRGLFIRHLAYALAERTDVSLQLWSPPGKISGRASYVATTAEQEWLARLMAVGGIAHLMRQNGLRGLYASLRLLGMLRAMYRRITAIDLYHVNWLQNALVLPSNNRPLLVTALGTDLQLLRLPLMRSLLRHAFRGRNVLVCPNADWMLTPLTNAFGDVAKIRCVPFGIDPDWFQVRRAINTGLSAKWLCITRLTQGKIGSLFDWCKPFFEGTNHELHMFGPMQESVEIPHWVHYHGPASPDTLRREWFPRAQGLITLSQHAEGRPQVMLEAMAAGLPIIASRLPAHTDLIRNGENGWICDGLDDVGRALDSLDDIAVNTSMGARTREWARTEIGTWDDCASRYAAQYRTLLDEATA
jgi:hypothetical protein